MRTPAIRRPRVKQRKTFAARVVTAYPVDGQPRWVLEVQRGAWRRTVDKEGEVIADTREPGAALWANIGDRLVVSATDLAVDQVASVEVVGVNEQSGAPRVRLACGQMPTGSAFVMPAAKAKKQRAKGARRTA